MLIGVETKGANLNGSPCTRALAVHLAWSPDARWTRLVTDPLTGILIDAGRTKYTIPKHLRNAVRLRDVTCRFPELRPQSRILRHRPRGPPPHQRQNRTLRPHPRMPNPPPRKNPRPMDPHHHHNPRPQTTWTGVFGISYTTTPPNQYRRD